MARPAGRWRDAAPLIDSMPIDRDTMHVYGNLSIRSLHTGCRAGHPIAGRINV